MKEISLHIMDIVQNSISADATLIEVSMEISKERNLLTLRIRDNGGGMDAQMLANVTSPFVTTRTTRKVGLGISLLSAGALAAGGDFEIDSRLGEGTTVKAEYALDHIDRPPIGDFAGTMHTLIVCNPNIDFVVRFVHDSGDGQLDTKEVRAVLGGDVPLDLPDVSLWIADNLKEVFPPEFAEI
jgi:signal transduction histidine kinase